ncbi:hypothetical protein ACFLRM_00260 [Acidobacteriota bacterium]
MSDQRPEMFMPALVGGVIAGILSGVPLISCLCCLWIIGGGMVSAYLLAKNTSAVLRASDGAIVGIFSGIVAAIINTLISFPFRALNREFARNFLETLSEYMEEMPSGWESWLNFGDMKTSFFMIMFGLVVSVVIFSVFGALGGVIGISLFGKKPIPIDQGDRDVPKDTSDHQS